MEEKRIFIVSSDDEKRKKWKGWLERYKETYTRYKYRVNYSTKACYCVVEKLRKIKPDIIIFYWDKYIKDDQLCSFLAEKVRHESIRNIPIILIFSDQKVMRMNKTGIGKELHSVYPGIDKENFLMHYIDKKSLIKKVENILSCQPRRL